MEKFIKELVSLPNKRNKKFKYEIDKNSAEKDSELVTLVLDGITAINLDVDTFNKMIVDYITLKQQSTIANKWLIVEKCDNSFLEGVPTPKQKLEMLKKEVYDKLGLPLEQRSPKTIKNIFHGVFPEDARSTFSWNYLKENAVNLEMPESTQQLEKMGLSAKDLLNAKDFDFIVSRVSGKKYDVVKNKNFLCFSES